MHTNRENLHIMHFKTSQQEKCKTLEDKEVEVKFFIDIKWTFANTIIDYIYSAAHKK